MVIYKNYAIEMNNIKVSIIIPIYNTEQYLNQCLDSVINQTFQDIEIIVINDGSTDNSLNIIKEYQQKDSRIILINFTEHKIISEVRNEGLKNTKGKYITFIDSDDWVTKDYVKTLYDNIIKYDCDIVATNFYFCDKDKNYRKNKFPNFYHKDNFSKNKNKEKLFALRFNWHVWTKIYKRDFIINNKIFFDGIMMDDILFTYKSILMADNIIFINKRTYFYRTFRIFSTTLYDGRCYYVCKIINQIKNLLISNNLYQKYKQSFYSCSYLLLATEFERGALSKQEYNELCFKIKNELLNEKYIKVKIFDRLPYKIRTYLFIFCLKYNINYQKIGKTLRKFYLFFTR